MIALFGPSASHLISNLGQIDHFDSNFLVMGPRSQNCKISTSTYHFLNCRSVPTNVWVGWKIMWSPRITPRVKHFILLAFHGRVNTNEYLYYLNLGPRNVCILYGDDYESFEHLIVYYRKSQLIWNELSYRSNHSFIFPDGFCSGNWITDSNHSILYKLVIAAVAWYIWK